MPPLSRRQMLTGLAAAGIITALPRRVSAATPASAPFRLRPAARRAALDQLIAYFSHTGPQLLRPAEGVLKYPSIAPSLPGRQYATNLWDWDTLWTTRGLFQLAQLTHDAALHHRVVAHAQGSLLNFLDHQSAEGRIPIMISVHDPDPLGTLLPAPTPNPRNQAKPVFGQLALLACDEAGDAQWLASHFDRILAFHASWARNNRSGTGLLVWGDDVAIGNDNDPTTFGRPFFSSANLLLNTLYYQDLVATAELARRLGRPRDAGRITRDAATLAEHIRRYCWDPRDQFFYTVDTQCVDRRAELIKFKRGMAMSWKCLPLKIQTFTGFLPLWCGVATPAQAHALLAENYDQRFHGEWGIRSLSSREEMYSMDFSSNPSNWLGPVWIIVNYFVWRALGNYGRPTEARELADQTLRLLATDLDAHGSLNEYYHPDSGAALSHPGFMDWNLLVLEMAGGTSESETRKA